VQEALTNVFRHSEAHKVAVSLRLHGSHIEVSVRDDGKGIGAPLPSSSFDGAGVGIRAMKQRVDELGGELRISDAAPGTLVEVTLPCRNAVVQETSAAI
jgi:signal transduction histidine kinase